MLKKLFTAAAIFTTSYSIAFADAPYISSNLSVINNASNGGRSDYRGFSGNLALGYSGIVGSRIYLGGEVFIIPGSVTITGNDLLKTTWGVGASFMPGIMINEKAVTYVRLGAIDSRFSYTNQNVVGGQIGLGLQTMICPNLDLRGEYVYSRYSSIDNFSSPNSDAFNLGLVYKFE